MLFKSIERKLKIKIDQSVLISESDNLIYKIFENSSQRTLILRQQKFKRFTDVEYLEELHFINFLNRQTRKNYDKFVVPQLIGYDYGIRSTKHKKNRVVLTEFLNGKVLEAGVASKNASHLGRAIKNLHRSGALFTFKRRRLWDAMGLCGAKSTFGSMHSIRAINVKDRRIIADYQKIVFHFLESIQRDHPKQLGAIHGDIHLNNILSIKKTSQLGLIDFDDTGFGFYFYDLATIILSFEDKVFQKYKNESEKKNQLKIDRFQQALLEAYLSRPPNNFELTLLEYLKVARKISMICCHWKRDPKSVATRNYLKSISKIFIRHLKSNPIFYK